MSACLCSRVGVWSDWLESPLEWGERNLPWEPRRGEARSNCVGVQSPEVEGPGDGAGEVEGVEPAVNLPEIHCRTWRPHTIHDIHDIKAATSGRINRSQTNKSSNNCAVHTTTHWPITCEVVKWQAYHLTRNQHGLTYLEYADVQIRNRSSYTHQRLLQEIQRHQGHIINTHKPLSLTLLQTMCATAKCERATPLLRCTSVWALKLTDS